MVTCLSPSRNHDPSLCPRFAPDNILDFVDFLSSSNECDTVADFELIFGTSNPHLAGPPDRPHTYTRGKAQIFQGDVCGGGFARKDQFMDLQFAPRQILHNNGSRVANSPRQFHG